MSQLDQRSMSLRSFLWFMMLVLIFIGVTQFSWVVFKSLTSSNDDDEQADKVNQQLLKIDISSLVPGQLYKTDFLHKEIWVYHRTEDEITGLKQHREEMRSVNEKYFVFFPYETRRNCQVNLDVHKRVFYDPCYGQAYDMAGYPVDVVAPQGVQPLPVPAYQISNNGLLLINTIKNK
jgi:Rieske Fe-S protein